MTLPSVFVTDQEEALRNAVKTQFPEAKTLLCSVHIISNFKKNVMKTFKPEDDKEKYEKKWIEMKKAVDQLIASVQKRICLKRLIYSTLSLKEKECAWTMVKSASVL